MDEKVARQYFQQIKQIWQPVAGTLRVIPFCTPVIGRPRALVIGTNHSDFVKGGGAEADEIAIKFAARLPEVSTFLEHSHQFSLGLRRICLSAKVSIDDTWVGTNRCAVQTGPLGIATIRSENPGFAQCQSQMDDLLRRIVEEIKPYNVLLFGSYAAKLFPECEGRLKDRKFAPVMLGEGKTKSKVIALSHASYSPNWKYAVKRLREHFVR